MHPSLIVFIATLFICISIDQSRQIVILPQPELCSSCHILFSLPFSPLNSHFSRLLSLSLTSPSQASDVLAAFKLQQHQHTLPAADERARHDPGSPALLYGWKKNLMPRYKEQITPSDSRPLAGFPLSPPSLSPLPPSLPFPSSYCPSPPLSSLHLLLYTDLALLCLLCRRIYGP